MSERPRRRARALPVLEVLALGLISAVLLGWTLVAVVLVLTNL